MTRHLKTNAHAIEVGLQHMESLDFYLPHVQATIDRWTAVQEKHATHQTKSQWASNGVQNRIDQAKSDYAEILALKDSVWAALIMLGNPERAWPDANEDQRIKLTTEQRRVIGRVNVWKYSMHLPLNYHSF
jgi:hypothetical protein